MYISVTVVAIAIAIAVTVTTLDYVVDGELFFYGLGIDGSVSVGICIGGMVLFLYICIICVILYKFTIIID